MDKVVITKDLTQTTKFGGMTANYKGVEYIYSRTERSITCYDRRIVAKIQNKAWGSLTQQEVTYLVYSFDDILTKNQDPAINVRFY